MTLVQLEYIVAVDTYRSFVAAAEKCFVTQPTLSMQVQKLEETLGVKLFDRSRQPVVPTEIGTQIIQQARKILDESARIRELIDGHQGEIKGDLKVGVIPTLAPYLMPGVITGMLKNYPALRLQIWELTTDQIIAQLKNGLLDCGLLSTPLGDQALQEIPLLYESFAVYLSDNSPLVKKKYLSSKDIAGAGLWLLNEGHCMRNQVLNICRQKDSGDHPQNFEYNTGSVETLKRMVDLGNGITILPELSLGDLTHQQLERVRYFKTPEPVREISIVTHRNFLKRSAIDALEKQILSTIPKNMRSNKKREVVGIKVGFPTS
ncbi:hydrogen peroxide-inducible genes activator [Hufsiella ginkgonis]|uniref:LysR family transcriptional regulator n=1 Tax=Hufsiella ginkgonis TaxID=2695274 RepID=A0A7K1XT70_9SPHI|nr:hydrogen peroxide-inducible genes activator [Hufsiella ginkgonis]MXV13969.1 LysR family transcriptional regulator [Hufsiella ginkgonis]